MQYLQAVHHEPVGHAVEEARPRALALSQEGVAFVHELHRLSHEEGVVNPSGDYGNASRAQKQMTVGKSCLSFVSKCGLQHHIGKSQKAFATL